MESIILKELLLKYASGNITAEEKEVFFSFLDRDDYQEKWKTWINELSQSSEQDAGYQAEEWEPMIRSILYDKAASPVIPLRAAFSKRKIAWAAAILFIALSGSFYFFYTPLLNKELARQPVKVIVPSPDIPPGADGAILTLADGTTLVLDSMSNGLVTTQGNTRIILNNGIIAYISESGKHPGSMFNIITTPRGRQYRLQLPDGTNVWLNAASSIKYPIAFTGSERSVSITGEAYFEVAKNAALPFRVNVSNAYQVEVLGTHFNVNAYADENSLNTTLLEGAVKIIAEGGAPVKIKPGQQARYVQHSGKAVKVIDDVNTENIVAWKNGAFSFHDAPIRDVLRQLSRWYDVDIVYNGKYPEKIIRGKMGRDLSLSQIIIVLKGLRVNLSLEGERKLVVLPDLPGK
ncbi:MAG: FecR domain-containing protein [Flavitalea sp.]